MLHFFFLHSPLQCAPLVVMIIYIFFFGTHRFYHCDGPSIPKYQETLYREVVGPAVIESAFSEPEEIRVGYATEAGAGPAIGLRWRRGIWGRDRCCRRCRRCSRRCCRRCRRSSCRRCSRRCCRRSRRGSCRRCSRDCRRDRRGSRRWSACCSDDDFIRVERWVNNQRALAPAAETLGCDRVPVEKERRRLPPLPVLRVDRIRVTTFYPKARRQAATDLTNLYGWGGGEWY
ncbi:hypothetical protein Naga_101236g1 [Nannochloropsis gaditana]|uniref:Uncharacterized protein n=1 Tax=Nannochloropsis gaditana TaxID=72520 RepID=W7T0C3_9STRA|nr:hypothetical protein Naga_101236g1 [Nannochloropsis gaditana]